MSNYRKILKQFIPPILLKLRKDPKTNQKYVVARKNLDSSKQDLDLYWDEEYSKILDEWGKDNTWNEIQMLLCSCKGRVLDIACGTGQTITLLQKFPNLELHGFDISDLLIQKAVEKGIDKNRLKVLDATKTNYSDNEFDYSYSIGSLEHFTEDGIDKFLEECSRYTKLISVHMIPISRSGNDEGWLKTTQSFFNNSEAWWMHKYKKHFSSVYVISSKWEDEISFGKWFICVK